MTFGYDFLASALESLYAAERKGLRGRDGNVSASRSDDLREGNGGRLSVLRQSR